MVFSSDSKKLVVGSLDFTAIIYNIAGGKIILTGHTGTVDTIAITSDNELVITGSYDYTVKIWKMSDGTLLGTLNGHS